MVDQEGGSRLRRRAFRLAVVLKGIDGILEVVGGALLIVFGPGGVSRTVTLLTQHELVEDPNDVLASILIRFGQHLGAGTVHFAAAYLFAHGVVKLWLAGGLIRGRRFIFPAALVVLGLFVLYQVYRLVHRFSAGLAALTMFDLVIIALIWGEWRAIRASSGGSPT
jgi:uncharacterized membrane protein